MASNFSLSLSLERERETDRERQWWGLQMMGSRAKGFWFLTYTQTWAQPSSRAVHWTWLWKGPPTGWEIKLKKKKKKLILWKLNVRIGSRSCINIRSHFDFHQGIEKNSIFLHGHRSEAHSLRKKKQFKQ